MREELFSRKKKEERGRGALGGKGLRGVVGWLGGGNDYKTARYSRRKEKGMNQEGIDAFHILLNRSSVFTRKPKGIQL